MMMYETKICTPSLSGGHESTSRKNHAKLDVGDQLPG